MKILMTSDTFLPSMGGAEIHVMNLIKYLRKNGDQVHLITTQTTSTTKTEKDIIRVRWGKFIIWKIIVSVWRELKAVDLVHAHYSYRLAAVVGIIARIRNVPMVVTLHGMGILDRPHSNAIYKYVDQMYRLIALKCATHVIATSDDLAKCAYKYIAKDKVSIIYNGYDSDIFYPPSACVSSSDSPPTIMTVRRLVPKNGIQYLIETLPYLKQRLPSVRYLMIGDGRLRPYIRSRIKKLGLFDTVTILGEQDNVGVARYMQMADLVIFPSTAESASIACAEAMGMRKCVVASRVGGLVELVGRQQERGYLVKLVEWERSNYDAPMQLDVSVYKKFAEVIFQALVDTESTMQKATAAYKYAHNNLRWETIVKKTRTLYLEKLLRYN